MRFNSFCRNDVPGPTKRQSASVHKANRCTSAFLLFIGNVCRLSSLHFSGVDKFN